MIDIEAFTMDEARALPTEMDAGAGVYFLWKGDTLLYIGSSKDAMARIAEHYRWRRFGVFNTNRFRAVPFDRHTVLACQRNDARDIELALLRKFGRPQYNEGLMPGDPG